MGKDCRSASHQMFKENAKNRVDDLQGMFSDLQSARRESRVGDVAVLEVQVNQIPREWRAELNEASPANSLLEYSQFFSGVSSEIRFLQNGDEEDDATSKFPELPPTNMKPEPVDTPEVFVGSGQGARSTAFQEELLQNEFVSANQYRVNLTIDTADAVSNCQVAAAVDYPQYNLNQDMQNNLLADFQEMLPMICPPPAAFLRPKCALWDCTRPTLEWCQDYCSSVHATWAFSEGCHAKIPVLRPRGIYLKDGPLFVSLAAKAQGKDVGIPQCEGAAIIKSPWNAPDLFNISLLEGESLREWLFFDTPRRVFESGNRKQRSLPDYSGRGWHESRKQVMREFGGLKRSYYMDPQPSNDFEWHLFEYELSNSDVCALYRLELKLTDHKKSSRAKPKVNLLVDLQQQMAKLSTKNCSDKKQHGKGRAKANHDNTESAQNELVPTINGNPIYGPHLPYAYSMEDFNNNYYGSNLK